MALAKWGELLLELAMLKQGEEATTILLQVNSQKKKMLHSSRHLSNALPLTKTKIPYFTQDIYVGRYTHLVV
jgi:hypothetical protein